MVVSKVKKMPLNDEVKLALTNFIREMDVQKNNKLPREEALAEMLGVSRVTLRRVLAELAQEGILFRKHGKGTFVNVEVLQIKVPFTPAQEFERMIRNSGYTARVELISVEIKEAGKEIASKLQIDEDDEIVVIEKVFYADENPAIYCINGFPKKILKREILDGELSENVFTYLEREAGRKIVNDIIEMTAVISSDNEKLKEHMNCSEPKAFLTFDGLNFDQNNIPVLYDLNYYDTDYIKFNSHRPKNV